MRKKLGFSLSLFLASVLICLTFTGSVLAETEPDPEKFIQSLAQQAISAVADHQISETERAQRFHDLFVSNFDVPEIGRYVLARYWSGPAGATVEQQQTFLKLFESIEVLKWARRFKRYQGEMLESLGSNKDREREWLVQSQIVRNPAPPIPVEWRVHQSADGSFRIIDIKSEGASMRLTLRQDYNAVLQAEGGRIESLLDKLRGTLEHLKAEGE
ncbi:MAG TPA: ABC transporter substrate-binding protein [Rhodospirillaceae bacterium]|nr:ABC transporter substrate-binding protein [Rhodospirillaceae bacterium]